MDRSSLDWTDGMLMMLTGEADNLGRTFQEKETAQLKANEGEFDFLKAFFSCRSCKKKKRE